MKPSPRSILSRLDDTVRWTGIPARVANDMSDAPSVDRKHRPLRWTPLWPIAFSCGLFILLLTWPPALDAFPFGSLSSLIVGFMCSIVAMVPGIYMYGPLGKPSLEDDEREAALRKDSFRFCLWLLAVLNGLGQPVLLILSHGQNWPIGHTVLVAASALMLNATLLTCLPTLYASWNLTQLPNE